MAASSELEGEREGERASWRRRVQLVGRAALKARALLRGADGDARRGSDGGAADDERPEDVAYLRALQPREWREQDHYRVLGLAGLRHLSTDDDVRRAYRLKVLRHHPDKRKALGERVNGDDDYFTCITKANEILGTLAKRRSYDSVDPHFDDNIPTGLEPGEGFYETFAPYFELNSRWSEKKNVPLLGDDESPREEVEKFYSFWYDFESWREYSYDDEEEKEKGQDREERRWIEKQNKSVRAKKKKEEMVRIRALVDVAYNNDPRIVKFKQDEKDKKLAIKKARQDAAQARKAEEERQLNEARLAKESADREEKIRADGLRAEREALKKQSKKERKIFRDFCKTNNYFIDGDSETVAHMSAVEKICEVLKPPELQDLNKNLSAFGRPEFLKIMNETESKLEAERKSHLDSQKNESSKSNSSKVSSGPPPWSQEMVQLLIKTVNFFPAGTNQRWEVVANFVNQHGIFEDQRRFNAKDVLSKAKDLQNSDYSKSFLKVAANQEAFDKFEKEKKKPPSSSIDDSGISVSFDGTKPMVNGSTEKKASKDNKMQNGEAEPAKKKPEKIEEKKEKEEASWSKVEQELLEQAIKTYPVNTPERWDRISECIPNRTKKECMKRFKELVDLVKAKKAAAQMNK